MAFSLLARMADGPLVEAGLFMNMMVELLNDGLLVVALALPASASTDFFSGELVEQCFLLFGFDGSILDGRRRQKKKWGGRRKGRKRKSPHEKNEKSRARAHFRESGVSPPKYPTTSACFAHTQCISKSSSGTGRSIIPPNHGHGATFALCDRGLTRVRSSIHNHK